MYIISIVWKNFHARFLSLLNQFRNQKISTERFNQNFSISKKKSYNDIHLHHHQGKTPLTGKNAGFRFVIVSYDASSKKI